MQMVPEAALAGQLADDSPGEFARRRMGILPPVHRRDGDRDGVRELLLGQSELAPESADHVAGVDVHACVSTAMSSGGSNPRATGTARSGLRNWPRLC